MQWTVLEDAEAVAQRACQRISEAAASAIGERGVFSLVLAGGSTPKRCYELLAATRQDWPRWQIYFGDERCLPRNDPGRNSIMAAEALLTRVPIPEANVHAIPAERGAPAAASAYAESLANALPFDLVLLGMGEDGHTASLFPGHASPEDERVHAVFDAPKPPPERVSLSETTLANARAVLFLVTGASKRAAAAAWRAGDRTLPVARIEARAGGEVLLDRDAAGSAD
jgi:6-phosphogluconolactonase